jgi:ATP-binding cassette, subfamily B, bacterial
MGRSINSTGVRSRDSVGDTLIRELLRFRSDLRPYRRVLGLGVALTLLDVGVSLAQPWPMRYIVDGLLAPENGKRPSDPTLYLLYGIVGIAGLAIIGALVNYWSTRLLSASGLNIGSDLRVRVMAHLQRLSLRYHGEHRVGDLASRVTSDVDRTQDMFVQVLATLFPSVILVVGMFVVMVVVDPLFTLLALLTTPPLIFATHRSRKQLQRAARQTRKADGALAAAAVENLSIVQLVQAFTLEDERLDRFDELSNTSLAAGLHAVRYQARFGPLVDITSMLSAAVVLWFGARQVLQNRLSLGVLLVFLSYLNSLFKPVKALSKLSNVVSKGRSAAERLADVLDTDPKIADSPFARPTRVTGRVEFENVSFSYGREPVLDQLSFAVEAGQTVAFVGPTGAGKSTILSLIPRLIDADSGFVRVDDLDVRNHQVASLRGQISMVLQDSLLLEGTLRDNIICGRIGATESDVLRAAKLALVDEFASALPDGLDTRIGERGANLSGGQRQRVAIARAILRDAPITILDEPTSALDGETEALLMEALSHLPAGRTKLVIAHRLSTIRDADTIFVIEQGRLAQQGTHDELLLVDGLYQRLAAFSAGPKRESATTPRRMRTVS